MWRKGIGCLMRVNVVNQRIDGIQQLQPHLFPIFVLFYFFYSTEYLQSKEEEACG